MHCYSGRHNNHRLRFAQLKDHTMKLFRSTAVVLALTTGLLAMPAQHLRRICQIGRPPVSHSSQEIGGSVEKKQWPAHFQQVVHPCHIFQIHLQIAQCRCLRLLQVVPADRSKSLCNLLQANEHRVTGVRSENLCRAMLTAH